MIVIMRDYSRHPVLIIVLQSSFESESFSMEMSLLMVNLQDVPSTLCL